MKKIIARINPVSIIKNSSLFNAEWYEKKYGIAKKNAARHYFEHYEEGFEPSKNFSGRNYLKYNPDVNMNPLLHYEVYGKKENRIRRIENENVVVENVSPTFNTTFMYGKIPNSGKVGIFALHNNTIPDYVVYYLDKLKDFMQIILISDSCIEKRNEIDKVANIIDFAYFSDHTLGYFGSYKLGLEFLDDRIKNVDRLYFINDSCYGSVNDLTPIFEEMNNKDCDFWGLLDSTDTRYHLLPMFYCFNNNVINDNLFTNFFDRVTSSEHNYVVYDLIREFTKHLEQKFTSDCYEKDFSNNSLISVNGHTNSAVAVKELIESDFPLIDIVSLQSSTNIIDILNLIKVKNKNLYDIIVKDVYSNTKNNNLKFIATLQDKKVISFDVFDTLLVRPFIRPTDLFWYIEKNYQMKGFAKARIQAEERARLEHEDKEDINLDDIYKQVPAKYILGRNYEEILEMDFCKANPLIKTIYNEAKASGAKIIATSDMYLPKTIITSMLFMNGFNVDEVFVSNELDKTKASGTLYRHILDKYNISGKDMAHIGDNYLSDIENAKKFGISTYHISTLKDNLLNNTANVKYQVYNDENDTVQSSIHLAAVADRRAKISNSTTYNTELGFELGGPLTLAYLNYIHEEAIANHIDCILFAARDGYMLKYLYDKYFKNVSLIDTGYVYLTRAVILSSTLNYQDEPRYLKTILLMAKEKFKGIKVSDNEVENEKEFKKYKKKIKRWADENLENLKKHLSQFEKYKNIAIVDLTTGKFSSVMGATSVLGDKVKLGLFSGTFNNHTIYSYETFCKTLLKPEWEREIAMSEMLISSPEESILSLDKEGHPIYDNIKGGGRVKKYNELSKGIEDYIIYFKDRFKLNNKIMLSYEEWINLCKTFIDYRNYIDNKELEKVTFAKEAISKQDDMKFI